MAASYSELQFWTSLASSVGGIGTNLDYCSRYYGTTSVVYGFRMQTRQGCRSNTIREC